MRGAQAENLSEYRSYIQRRRVDDKPETGLKSDTAEKVFQNEDRKDKSKVSSITEVNMDNIDEFFAQNTKKARSDLDSLFGDPGSGSINESSIERVSPLKDLFKEDKYESGKSPMFRDVTKSGRRWSDSIYRRSTASYQSPSRYSAEVEDNRATLLAIKIIKQCIACFAILGLVVLMQKINSFSGVLNFLREHLVENHIEYETVFNGVEDLIKACSRFLGGTP